MARIVQLCGRLPLAIAITASQLRIHPTWSVHYLVDQLTHAHNRLDELKSGDRSVRAAFDTSLKDLPVDQRLLFTLLGVHHGPEIDEYAAAALANTSPTQARRALDALYTRHLIQETSSGRYRLHDLVRSYVHNLAAGLGPDQHLRATSRVLDYYLHTAHTSTQHLPARRTPTTPTWPVHPRPITNTNQALAWLTTELPTLLTAVDHTNTTHPAHTLHLSTTLHRYFRAAGYWHHAQTLHDAAHTTAVRMNDLHAQATALTDIGVVCRRRGDPDGAVRAFSGALKLYARISDPLGEGDALTELGIVHRQHGDFDAAVEVQSRALELYALSGSLVGQGDALTQQGSVYLRRGDLTAALDVLSRALELYIHAGVPLGQGDALYGLAAVHRLNGDLDAATAALSRALELHAIAGSPLSQGDALTDLGKVYRQSGDHDGAIDALTRGLKLYARVGDPLGEGDALTELGIIHRQRGDFDAAIEVQSRALELYARSGNPRGQANAHLGIGIVHRRRNEPDDARSRLTLALDMFTRADDPDGQAETHNALGDLALGHPHTGHAHTHYTTALTLARTCNSKLHEANALVGQAQFLHHTGNTPQAIALLRQALAIHQASHAPEATYTAQLLTTLDPNPPSQP
ncbi:tetratricopeptide repeat protein [Saccharothrix xinjiangensis]|uniref:Tetratricopeptide repeat protein n=1 Tax=Saccharothrix xinjiangensis TaxID=204798 RepID=A0ABV9Y1Y1_9PSEU